MVENNDLTKQINQLKNEQKQFSNTGGFNNFNNNNGLEGSMISKNSS